MEQRAGEPDLGKRRPVLMLHTSHITMCTVMQTAGNGSRTTGASPAHPRPPSISLAACRLRCTRACCARRDSCPLCKPGRHACSAWRDLLQVLQTVGAAGASRPGPWTSRAHLQPRSLRARPPGCRRCRPCPAARQPPATWWPSTPCGTRCLRAARGSVSEGLGGGGQQALLPRPAATPAACLPGARRPPCATAVCCPRLVSTRITHQRHTRAPIVA
jgi:hypothetical protein